MGKMDDRITENSPGGKGYFNSRDVLTNRKESGYLGKDWKSRGREVFVGLDKSSIWKIVAAFTTIIVVVGFIIYISLIAAPISDVIFSESVNLETGEPIGQKKTFETGDTEMYITFKVRNLDLGEIVYFEVYFKELNQDQVLYSEGSLVNDDNSSHYTYLQISSKDDYFEEGVYIVRFLVEDEIVEEVLFGVER